MNWWICAWDIKGERVFSAVKLAATSVFGNLKICEFSQDSRRLFATNERGEVGIWNTRTGDCERVLNVPARPYFEFCLSRDGAKFAANVYTGYRIWTRPGADPVNIPDGDGRMMYYPAFSPDADTLAIPTTDSILCFDASTGALRREIPCKKTPLSLAYSHDGKFIASVRGFYDADIVLQPTEEDPFDPEIAFEGIKNAAKTS